MLDEQKETYSAKCTSHELNKMISFESETLHENRTKLSASSKILY